MSTAAGIALPTLVGADAPPLTVRGLSLDARSIEQGDAFVALKGGRDHGLNHVLAAKARGAIAVIYDPAEVQNPPALPLPSAPLAQLRARLPELARRMWADPAAAMVMVGITGTNGKSTCVHLLGAMAKAIGLRAGTIGTLGSGPVGALDDSALTTPDLLCLTRTLAGMRDCGLQLVVMEVSSHALDQQRVAGIEFAVGGFSNLSRDHLDYHVDMEAYFAAKTKLFAQSARAVVNVRDAYGQRLASTLTGPLIRVGVEGADLWADQISSDALGTRFVLHAEGLNWIVRTPLLGRYNVDNLLLCLGVASVLGWPLAPVIAALDEIGAPRGRLERFGGDQQPTVVVDYAHTPDALANSLSTLRPLCRGRLIVIVGAGGDRDRGKRPLMTKAAGDHADLIVLTDDNPRHEPSAQILADLAAGLAPGVAFEVIADRAGAIAQTIAQATRDDLLLIAGKGHERHQEIAGQRLAFADQDHVIAALARWQP